MGAPGFSDTAQRDRPTPVALLDDAIGENGTAERADVRPGPPQLERVSETRAALSRVPFHAISRREGFRRTVRAVQDAVPAPAYYLYLLSKSDTQTSTRRLVLEYSDLPFERVPAWKEHLPPGSTLEQLQRPPTMLAAGKAADEWAVKNQWCGPVLSIPLYTGDRTFAGVLLCGPLRSVHGLRTDSEDSAALAQAVAASVRHVKAYERMRRRIESLETKGEVRRKMLGSTLAPDRFVGLLLNLALTVTSDTGGFVALHDEERGCLTVRAESGLPAGFLEAADLSLGGLFEQPPGHSDVLFVRNEKLLRAHGITSLLAVPLTKPGSQGHPGGDHLTGVFALASTSSKQMLSSFELELLVQFAEKVEAEIENTEIYEAFTQRYLSTLHTLSAAYDGRSPQMKGHSQAVAHLAAALGHWLGSTPDQIASLRSAGLVHDVGLCTSPLGDEQAHFRHPSIGAGLLEVLPVAEDVVEGVRTHHEWHNGWGFPQGLAGEDIPRSGCILSVAEFVAERRAGHELRPPASLTEIGNDILQGRNQQFNPYVADALLAMLDDDAARRSIEQALAKQGERSDPA